MAASLKVIEQACRKCAYPRGCTVVTAERPGAPLEKGLAGPGLLAHVVAASSPIPCRSTGRNRFSPAGRGTLAADDVLLDGRLRGTDRAAPESQIVRTHKPANVQTGGKAGWRAREAAFMAKRLPVVGQAWR